MLIAGTKLGPYEILAPLGAGGMGEVYRARDTRLDRIVAIKVLSSHLSDNPDMKQRFEREARTISSLSHSHICALHDIGHQDGIDFLVMEYLEGETLAARLQKGALTTDLVLRYGIEIADALDKAHRQGVVHRDLKPGNIMLTKSGVKLLDFGLAKLRRSTEQELSRASALETEDRDLTAEGTILGTLQYMSPEQLEGKETDGRTDIFAFGTVLYEMVTGKKAFEGKSQASLIAAILKEEPRPISTLQPMSPPTLERVVRKCLAKDPDDRWQSAGDLKSELQWITESTSQSALPAVHDAAWWNRKRPLLLGMLMIGISVMSFFAGRSNWFPSGRKSVGSESKGVSPPSFYQLTFRRGTIRAARFAPDGQTILYSAAWDGNPPELFTTRLHSAESLDLGVACGDALAVSTSNELALSLGCNGFNFVLCSGTLATKPLTGGAPRELLENVQQTDWAPGGTQLLALTGSSGHNRLEFPIGKTIYEAAGWISHARVSPKADLVAFLEHPIPDADNGFVAVVDLSGRKRTLSGPWESLQGLAWSPTSEEIWFTATQVGWSRSLYAVNLSGKQLLIANVPGGLTLYDISKEMRVLATRVNYRQGIIALTPGQNKEHDLSWFNTSQPGDLSNDGQRLLFSENSEASGESGAHLRKTDGSSAPVQLGRGMPFAFSPDGKWALSFQFTFPPQFLLLPTGPGEEKLLPRGPITNYELAGAFFPDGKRILFGGFEAAHKERLYVQDLEGGKPRPISSEGVSIAYSQNPISPDGKFVAAIGPDGKAALFPVEGGEPRSLPTMVQGEVVVRWGADGHSLFVYKPYELPCKLFRVDLLTGRRELWKELMPADPAGLVAPLRVVLTPDGKSYAYGYTRDISELYLIEGLK